MLNQELRVVGGSGRWRCRHATRVFRGNARMVVYLFFALLSRVSGQTIMEK